MTREVRLFPTARPLMPHDLREQAAPRKTVDVPPTGPVCVLDTVTVDGHDGTWRVTALSKTSADLTKLRSSTRNDLHDIPVGRLRKVGA